MFIIKKFLLKYKGKNRSIYENSWKRYMLFEEIS